MRSSGVLTALGLMSGTSMDGVDVAVIRTDGRDLVVGGEGPDMLVGSRPYDESERDILRRALAEARGLSDRAARPAALQAAEEMVTVAHAEAVEKFLRTHDMRADAIDVVGFHGQTVLHRPEAGLTVQIGDGRALAERLGIDVVYDFRAADVAAGGEGAPLAPAYHRALARSSGLTLPLVVLNLGGVANVTWVGPEGDPVAFDTGPANALLDDWVRRHTGASHDAEGAIAARGRVDSGALARLLDDPYFAAPAPKSLDRDAFDASPVDGLSLEDGAATLVAFTAASVALAEPHFPERPRRWIVSGGGAHNPTLLAELGRRLDAPVETAASLGWHGDHVEAEAFAYLAVRSLRGLPLTFPTTTGVAAPLGGGVRVSPRRSAA